MSGVETSSAVESERQVLQAASAAGGWQKFRTYSRLSGPGWIASAITLGGGSLASSLYLGVISGYSLLWLQPFAMILGVIMLSTIGYVTLSTGKRPFPAINEHVSPVLGWSWALAVAAANVIWCMPQHALAFGVLEKNLLPSTQLLGQGGLLQGWAARTLAGDYQIAIVDQFANLIADHFDKLAISVSILLLATIVTWSYDRGGWGLRLYELLLKIVVALIVLCFFGVVMRLSFSSEPLQWSRVWAGLIPDFGQFFQPAASWIPFLDAIGPDGDSARQFWIGKIVSEQRDVMISAAATAVGINMTLMFPYTLLRRGWTKEFRGLATFDLCTGMFIPYILATGCVVLASAASFHTQLPDGFTASGLVLADQANGEPASDEQVAADQDSGGGPAADQNAADQNAADQIAADQTAADQTAADQTAADEPTASESTINWSAVTNIGDVRLTIDEQGPKFGSFTQLIDQRNAALTQQAGGIEDNAAVPDVTDAERLLAAMLVRRDAFDLAKSLKALTGPEVANWVFGLGVLGMVLSTISILMLISGFVFAEMTGYPPGGKMHKLGTLVAGFGGAMWPFFWAGQSKFYLAVVTSVFGFMLLPFAYVTFVFLLNSSKLLGDQMPRGARRFIWNVLAISAATLVTIAAGYMIWVKAHWGGIVAVVLFIGLVVMVWMNQSNAQRGQPRDSV